MQLFPVSIILLWITNIAFGDRDLQLSIEEDIKKLNASCPPYDTCNEPRSDSLSSYSCQCGQLCAQLGTCCTDSQYSVVTPPKIRPTCRSLDEDRAYLMVDRCPISDNKDPVWESLCEEEWNGEDVMKLVPVTSSFTHITYKNYFCFRCHERTNEFLYWNVRLGSSDYEFDETIDKSNVFPSYDPHYQTWVAPLGNSGSLIPVNLKIEIPQAIYPITINCEPNVRSQCSDTWFDKEVSDKCEAYMAIMIIERDGYSFKYRNVHCALCNFEDVRNMSCKTPTFTPYGEKTAFSFTHLLDINTSGGDKVGKIEKCESDFLWDPFSSTCKKLVCALPGYIVKDGKCEPP